MVGYAPAAERKPGVGIQHFPGSLRLLFACAMMKARNTLVAALHAANQ